MLEKSTILNRTSGGLDVFVHYFGNECLKKNFRNPYRHDTMPSCHLYVNSRNGSGRFWMQDFGDTDWCGDCFAIAARINNINLKSSFSDVLEVINRDLGLGLEGNYERVKDVTVRPKVDNPVSTHQTGTVRFNITYKSFTPFEIAYWHQYGIEMPTLVNYHVSSVRQCDILMERKNFSLFGTDMTPCFAYIFGGGKGLKLYRPKSKNRFFYCGELPKPYVFGWEQLHDHGDTVFITGGEKDVMSLSSHGFDAISFNSETAIIPEHTVEELLRRFGKVVILYDCDETGVRESEQQFERLGEDYKNVRRLTLPLAGTKEEKDISDWYCLGHTSEELKELLKKL